MKKRILWNDIKENRLLSVSTGLFMAACAFMAALTCFLAVNLLGSVDRLMDAARTPDFLQMHSGSLPDGSSPDGLQRGSFPGGPQDEASLDRLAKEPEVEAYQVLCFLNLENSRLTLGGRSLSDSTQDNGVCVQSEKFDFLLDLDNKVIEASEGEIYVPVCYRQKYGVRAGERVGIGEDTFVIAGFLRDSQMNSMTASSKRFLISAADYEKLKRSKTGMAGSEEYLIEYRLKEDAEPAAFAKKYQAAGLPSNGPTITGPLIRMLNVLSEGPVILVVFLSSVLLLLISMLCIRFALMTALEADRRRIGILKALGIGRRYVRQIYFLRFLALSTAGALVGFLAAAPAVEALSKTLKELYGPPQTKVAGFATAFAGVLLTQALLLFFVRRTLGYVEKLSAVEALTGERRAGNGKKRPAFSSQDAVMALVIAAGIFMMTLPQNLLNTVASPGFVTCMGIGDGEIRMDLLQSKELAKHTERVEEMLAKDRQISRQAALRTRKGEVLLPDGAAVSLHVEQGDHTVFPVAYTQGEAPQKEGELALSWLCAEELGLFVGDSVKLSVGGQKSRYRVCGIYSDITNGGKTAKAAYLPEGGTLMWSIFYVSLKEGISLEAWIAERTRDLEGQGVSAKITDIHSYVEDTWGPTLQAVARAAHMAVLIAAAVTFLTGILFTRLRIARERYDISLQKALGLTGKEIGWKYALRHLPVASAGILAGSLAGNLWGEKLAGLLLRSFGAVGFRLLPDYGAVFGWIPALSLLSTGGAVLLGLWGMKRIRACECCREAQ